MEEHGPAQTLFYRVRRRVITRPLNLEEAIGAPQPFGAVVAPGSDNTNGALRWGRRAAPATERSTVASAPIRVILEPSYVLLAPVRPAPIEAVLPSGVVCWQPAGGIARQERLRPAEARYLYDQALAVLKLPRPPPSAPPREVVPTIVILRHAGFAYRWWLLQAGPPALRGLVAALTELAGYSTHFEESR